MTTASDQARALEAKANGKVCVVCKAREPKVDPVPQVAWIQGEHVLKCHCFPTPPVLDRPVKRHNERLGEVTMQALARQGDYPVLDLDEIRKYINPKATEQEGMFFLRFCEGQGLNPFINEAYLIKYDDKSPAAIVVGIAAVIKKAGLNPNYQGFQTGIVVDAGLENYVNIDGSLAPKGATIVGGWASTKRKDWLEAKTVVVSFNEYDTGRSLWKAKPGTMIEKVALAQLLRRVFPEDIESLYGAGGELKVEVVAQEVIEAEAKVVFESPDGDDFTNEPIRENPAGVVTVLPGGVKPVWEEKPGTMDSAVVEVVVDGGVPTPPSGDTPLLNGEGPPVNSDTPPVNSDTPPVNDDTPQVCSDCGKQHGFCERCDDFHEPMEGHELFYGPQPSCKVLPPPDGVDAETGVIEESAEPILGQWERFGADRAALGKSRDDVREALDGLLPPAYAVKHGMTPAQVLNVCREKWGLAVNPS